MFSRETAVSGSMLILILTTIPLESQEEIPEAVILKVCTEKNLTFKPCLLCLETDFSVLKIFSVLNRVVPEFKNF